ncbi:MAG TPA: hypothetical protein ENN28_00020, partial [Candidatus Uhrbacteria bacterium]|nr:hypothetical protein [Candidatus Uhrbacteria bacterium]
MAPILIFYASGYRYDIKLGKILKTGTLMLEAKGIKNASLYINDKLYEKPFDEKIFVYNLLPGDYNIRLEKENYYSWQKKISIQSSLTTFVRDIIFFKKNIPLQIVDEPTANFYLSPDEQKIAYIKKTELFSELYLLDIRTKEKIFLYRASFPESDINLSWAASSKKILAQINNHYFVFNVQQPEQILEIEELLDFEPNNLKWDIGSDNILFALKQNPQARADQAASEIYKIDLLAKTKSKIFESQEELINQEFFIEANDVFYIKKENTRDNLYKYNLNFKTTKLVTKLGRSANYKFIKSTNNYLGLIDSDNQKLFLIQKIITSLEITIQSSSAIKEFNAINAVWDRNEKWLLFHDGFEVKFFDTVANQEIFINRYGQKINRVCWHHELQHIVILFQNNLNIIDLGAENGERNVIEIIKFDQLDNFYFAQKGEIIYFQGKIGRQEGIYQIIIR